MTKKEIINLGFGLWYNKKGVFVFYINTKIEPYLYQLSFNKKIDEVILESVTYSNNRINYKTIFTLIISSVKELEIELIRHKIING